MTMRVAVAISGRGSNVEALLRALPAGGPAEVVLVLSDRPDAGGLARAQERGIPTAVLTPPADAAAWLAPLDEHRADLLVLAGFIKLVPEAVIARYRGRVINIHPALLPAFGGKGMYGRRVHEAVLEYGAKVSGCTVHFADDTYDTGPVLVQKCVPVKDDDDPDTLAARVFEAECEAYPEAIRLLAGGRVAVVGRRILIAG